MSSWQLRGTPAGLCLSPRRVLGSEEFTWADLLSSKLAAVQVYVIYFPSRFDLDVDRMARDTLASFGRKTGPTTSVNFWNPTDPEFSRALGYFDVKTPPALVLISGLRLGSGEPVSLDKANLYSIVVTDPTVLGTHDRLASTVNCVHEILLRSDPHEITQYLRARALSAVLAAIANAAGDVFEEILQCKPKFGLPGGFSVQLGA